MQTCEARDFIRSCATNRDSELWQEFVERFGRRLSFGVQRTLARFDARVTEDEREDLLQEVYCRLLEKQGRSLRRCRGQVEAAVVAYLGRVAESVVVDYLRTRSAAKRGRGLLLELRRDMALELADRAVDPRQTPEERLLMCERRFGFFFRCGELVGKKCPQRDLQILYLALFEGWTSREICGRLGQGIKPGTVDSLVHRLKKRLANLGIEIPRRRPGAARVIEVSR